MRMRGEGKNCFIFRAVISGSFSNFWLIIPNAFPRFASLVRVGIHFLSVKGAPENGFIMFSDKAKPSSPTNT